MSLSTFNEYLSKLENTLPTGFAQIIGTRPQYGTFTAVGGSTPTTAVVVDNTTTGKLIDIPSDTVYVHAYTAGYQNATGMGEGMPMLTDRLSHQGGLSSTVTTPQTTNLPTAALTRYTDGYGVMIALDVYTQTGGSATTVTASYTNSDGIAGRTTEAVVWISSAPVGRRFILPLQAGDVGVRSVESVTFAGSTGTSGNVGVTLFKPLAFFQGPQFVPDGQHIEPLSAMYGALVAPGSTACIEVMSFGGSSSLVFTGSIKLIET